VIRAFAASGNRSRDQPLIRQAITCPTWQEGRPPVRVSDAGMTEVFNMSVMSLGRLPAREADL